MYYVMFNLLEGTIWVARAKNWDDCVILFLSDFPNSVELVFV